MSAVEAQHIAKLTVKMLQGMIMRIDDTLKHSLILQQRLAQISLPRPRKVSRRLDDGASQCYKSPSVQEHYSRLYNEAMDLYSHNQHKGSTRSARISHVLKS